MPSTSHAAPSFYSGPCHVDRLEALGAKGRLRAYERGELTRFDLSAWAARYPQEPPTVNGEYAWIGLAMADLD